MKQKMSLREKLKAYKLDIKVKVCLVLVFLIFICVLLYFLPAVHESEVYSGLVTAVFTSFAVSVLVMATEIFVSYRDSKRDEFLLDIRGFGIDRLNQNKEETIREMLKDCDKTVWISGYRLIMTYNLRKDFADAVERGANGIAVICPPWTKAFKLVYGEHEKVIDYYFEVFHEIEQKLRTSKRDFQVFFITKPLFSDTYRIDQNLITGPYMHNKDSQYNRIMAKDFFSYNIIRKSTLYSLIYNEFKTMVEESEEVLDWEKFREAYEERKKSDYNQAEQIELLRKCLIPAESPTIEE